MRSGGAGPLAALPISQVVIVQPGIIAHYIVAPNDKAVCFSNAEGTMHFSFMTVMDVFIHAE